MPSVTARVGGRPPLIAVDDIVAAGRQIGMRDLSVHAVAGRLRVSPTALYRHIKGRWELERLVGESLLAELDLVDDETADTERHLVMFGLQLLQFTELHPGLGSYLQVLFPRGDAGARLLADQVHALGRRGYAAEAAMVLSSCVATTTISLAARKDSNAASTERDAGGFDVERDSAERILTGDARLRDGHLALPKVTSAQYVRLLLTASVRGLVAAMPPGRPIDDAIAELTSAGSREDF